MYIPRGMVDDIILNSQRPKDERDRNLVLCVRIPYKGFEVSVALDTSHTDGDLHRSDLRIYKSERNMTRQFMSDQTQDGESCYHVTAELLQSAFQAIDLYTEML